MSQKAEEFLIAITKTAAMRYIAETVGHGYYLYQFGEVPAGKVLQLIYKFDEKYQILATRGKRDNDRRHGRSCARLVLFPKESSPIERPEKDWIFWLLATEGEGDFPVQKATSDTRQPESRITWGKQYKLVSRPVRKRNGEQAYVWTWAMQEEHYERWKQAFHKAAGRVRSSKQRQSNYLLKLVNSLRRVPGFNGINRQKRALITNANLPTIWRTDLNLQTLGTVVNKGLKIFDKSRTVDTLLRATELPRLY